MKPSSLALTSLAFIALAALVSCGTATEKEAAGPGAAVQSFFEALNEQRYEDAMAMYDAETRAALEDPSVASESGFREWARAQTKNGTIDRVVILEAPDAESMANVRFELRYRDGSRKEGEVRLSLDGEQWRLGAVL
jgi:hypothetical protein